MIYNPSRNFWLLGFICLVLFMIALGGTTRLTRSGLSITEWQPVRGSLPPLSESDWLAEFEKYKATPEFQKVNAHFGLAEYKKIFFWEYLHRLLGRLIFFFALIPGIWLWRKNKVEGAVVIALPALVALQGLVGWLMVKSGLNHEPRVSPFMLALHYFMAILTLLVAYYFLSKRRPRLTANLTSIQKFLIATLGLFITMQIFYGCLTSGFRAGLYFNTFPMMGNAFFPSGALSAPSFANNVFTNPIMIQWIHRWLGVSTLLLIYISAFVFIKKSGPQFIRAFVHLISIATLQVIVGILLLLWVVPVPLAVFHQFMATLIVMGYCNIVFRLET